MKPLTSEVRFSNILFSQESKAFDMANPGAARQGSHLTKPSEEPHLNLFHYHQGQKLQ